MGKMLTRQKAWELLTRYTKTPSLQKHALAVEAVMKHFAKLNNEDVEKWGVVGLLSNDLVMNNFPENITS